MWWAASWPGSLVRAALVDRYMLLVPAGAGVGQRLFPDDGTVAVLRPVDTEPTTTGVLIATYQPAEPAAGKAANRS